MGFLGIPFRLGLLPIRYGHSEHPVHGHSLTSNACPQQQSRHFSLIARRGLNTTTCSCGPSGVISQLIVRLLLSLGLPAVGRRQTAPARKPIIQGSRQAESGPPPAPLGQFPTGVGDCLSDLPVFGRLESPADASPGLAPSAGHPEGPSRRNGPGAALTVSQEAPILSPGGGMRGSYS